MYAIIKLIKKFLKIINSNAAPWQVALGAAFGTAVGFMPLWPDGGSPAVLPWLVLLVALVINCHIGSLLFLLGITSLLHVLMAGPAVTLGNALSDLAQWSAGVWILHASYWSHTGYLGETLFGIVLAPIAGIAMYRLTINVRTRLLPKLTQRRRLVRTGKIAGNAVVARVVLWFFGV